VLLEDRVLPLRLNGDERPLHLAVLVVEDDGAPVAGACRDRNLRPDAQEPGLVEADRRRYPLPAHKTSVGANLHGRRIAPPVHYPIIRG
jgi:hypothetical protein